MLSKLPYHIITNRNRIMYGTRSVINDFLLFLNASSFKVHFRMSPLSIYFYARVSKGIQDININVLKSPCL